MTFVNIAAEPTDSRPEAAPARGLERVAEARVPLWAVGLMALGGLIGLIGYGAVVRSPDSYGSLGTMAVSLATVPETLSRTYDQIDDALGTYHPSLAGGYRPRPGGLWRNPAQPLVDPGALLVTVFDTARKRYIIRLVRLSDGRTLRDYVPDFAAIDAPSTFKSALTDLARDKTDKLYFPMHPLLMPDGGLVTHDFSPLVRVDACGRGEWMVDGIFHHSLEPDTDGTIWADYRDPISHEPGVGPKFADEGVAHLDAAGHVLGRTSVISILDRNGMGYLWRSRAYTDDPIHLNEVKPVPDDGPYWRKGDLFLSLRSLSMVLLYRPSTGRVLWSRAVPWRFQHDVEVIDDHRISVFDNHRRFAWDKFEHSEVDGTNHMVVYDFATDRTSEPLARVFHDEGFHSQAQGRATPLANGDTMIEDTEWGQVIRVAPDGTIRWRYISADAQDRRYPLRWSRYLDSVLDKAGISAAETARCT
jgi:hypothetical protein